MRWKLPLFLFLGLLAIGGGIFVASGQTVSQIANVDSGSMAYVDGVPAGNIAYVNGEAFSAGGGGSFTPLDLPNLLTWHDASDASTITESSGLVSQWDDKSGNGHHVLQGTAANQPTTGTRSQNGLNMIDFNRSDGEYMETNGAMTSISQPFTIMALVVTDTSLNQVFVGSHTDFGLASRIVRLGYDFGGSSYELHADLDAYLGVTGGSFDAFFGVYDTTSSDGYINGGADLVSDSPGTNDFQALKFGASHNNHSSLMMDGAIAEVIVVDGRVSTSDMNQVGNYWADKWGITYTDI